MSQQIVEKATGMRADLHMHSWASDGDVSPTEVVRTAVAARLDVIAITDHDIASGIAEGLQEAEHHPVTVIPGIEISSMWDGRELHILGYWIDPQSAPILEHQTMAVQRRSLRMEAMIERLGALGLEVTMADVRAAAGPSVMALGRPHLARAMHARGHTRFYAEAFNRYIGDSGPAYVTEGFPTPAEAIDTIHRAGGVAVWAHPAPLWFLEGIPLLQGWGLDGVECFRPGMDEVDVRLFEEETRTRGLFPSGGSDWHGPKRSTLGDFAVDSERVAELLRLGGAGG